MCIFVNIVVFFIIAVVYYKTVTESTWIIRYLYCNCVIEYTLSVNDSESEHGFSPVRTFIMTSNLLTKQTEKTLLATDRCNNCTVHNIGSIRSIVLRILLLSRSEQSEYRHVYAVKYYLNQSSFILLDRIFQKAGTSDGNVKSAIMIL